MDIQWYPGHMTKAKRQMQEDLKLIDLIIELLDARAPRASGNPDIGTLGAGKARLVLYNKADLADESVNRAWEEYEVKQGRTVLFVNSLDKVSLKGIRAKINEACRERIERNKRRGFKNRPVRAMVAGIPNVGKSTLINTIAGRASAKTGNRPGVTRGKQWIHLGQGLDLLDTPGILWPKFEDPKAGEMLAMIGSINPNLYNREELSLILIDFLKDRYPGMINTSYAIDESAVNTDILQEIAVRRNCLVRGNQYSTEKAADILLDEFRNGKLGRISLEEP